MLMRYEEEVLSKQAGKHATFTYSFVWVIPNLFRVNDQQLVVIPSNLEKSSIEWSCFNCEADGRGRESFRESKSKSKWTIFGFQHCLFQNWYSFHSVSYLKGFVAAKKSDVLTFTSFTAHNHVTSRLQLFSHVWPIHCWQDRYFTLDRLCHLILWK